MGDVTILGELLAREGEHFVYEGEVAPCASCRLRSVCHQLQVGRRYRVTRVRDVRHDCCSVFDGDVAVVEVEEAPLRMNVPAAALRGTGYTHVWDPCGVACPYKAQCDPAGVKAGEAVALVDVGEEPVDCKVGRDLRLASVRPGR